MKRLHRWQRMIRWHLNMAWTRHQFAEADEVLLVMRTAAFHQALAALDHQRETKHLPATQEQVDRLAQFAAERYLAGRTWRSKRLRRLAGRAAPDIFRNSFRETLLPKTDSFFHHGGPSL